MDIRPALKGQYHASLAMLKQAIERCPDAVWTERNGPRAFWRIAYHTLFFTHLYMQRNEGEFVQWSKHLYENTELWGADWEPGSVPKPYTKEEILDYWQICDSMVDECVDKIDLDSPNPGFHWYSMPKLDHQLMNLRHIQQHAGQLSEILMLHSIDTDWVGKCKGPEG